MLDSLEGDVFDLIIIGAGAGGATLAHALAPTGLRIAVLERGGYLPREKDNWNSRAVFTDERYHTQDRWLDAEGKPFRPGQHYYVGGNTKVYGSALLRFRESDFRATQHVDGISPAWPIDYAAFEPYYTRAERLYHVHGERGCDPTEPPASAPYPYPAVRNEPRIARLAADLSAIGLRPFALPMGLILDEDRRDESPCIRCSTCDGFPCLVNGKADAHIVAMLPALEHPNVTLETHAYVERLETSASGREITGVVVVREGRSTTLRAHVVVVSSGAVNSAALLLRSANDHHPQGLANGSGVVGRHYMCHDSSVMVAISKEPNPTVFQKTIGINDFYDRADDFPYPLGHIQMLGKSDGEMFRGDAPGFVPKAILDLMATHGIDFWLTTEDLPKADNRVTLERDGTIRLSYKQNNLEAHERLKKKLGNAMERIGAAPHLLPNNVYLSKSIPINGVAHQSGTVRFGLDPQTSALDLDCKAHELDNLYVVDSSFFVSITAVNPALTVAANAMRVAEHLSARFGIGSAQNADYGFLSDSATDRVVREAESRTP